MYFYIPSLIVKLRILQMCFQQSATPMLSEPNLRQDQQKLLSIGCQVRSVRQ